MATDVYRRLQQYFDSFPLRFPATESGVELRLLKRMFTSEEAEIAMNIKCGYAGSFETYETLDEIFNKAKKLGYSKEKLEEILDTLAKRGSIMGGVRENNKVYANALLLIGIYELQVDKLTKEWQEDYDQYMKEAWWPGNRDIRVNQIRTIPVGIKVDHDSPIANYDNIRTMFEQSKGPFTKANCVCRQSSDIQGQPCKATDRRQVCLAAGEMGQMYIEQGHGQEISKEEALEYLKKNEEEGLIFQLSNSQEVIFVCSCCTCCCEGLTFLSRIPNAADYSTSNYIATINDDLCSGCGNCIDRCQMNAITLESDIANLNQNRCIGCGNCILECPEEAIKLEAKENQTVPPLTTVDLFKELEEKRKIADSKSN